jgi:hypothetical protein
VAKYQENPANPTSIWNVEQVALQKAEYLHEDQDESNLTPL